MRSTIIFLNNFLFVLVPFGIPLLHSFYTGGFRRALLWGWLLFIGWFVIQVFIAGPIAYKYDRSMANFFSEGPSVVAALFTGWLWGAVVAALGVGGRFLLGRIWPSAYRRLCKPS